MQISIIGAGISGLTLARCLKHRGIQAIVYEKDSAQRAATRHGYGITLWAYGPLLSFLGLSETDFRRKCAVDGSIGGNGRVPNPRADQGESKLMPFRANRQRLELILREGLDVRWDHKLVDVQPISDRDTKGQVQLSFADKPEVSTDVVIGADGAHSPTRKAATPSARFNILPFAVYNGKRRVPRSTFEEKYAPSLDGLTTVEHNVGNTHLTLAVDDYNDERVSISYTFSRPTKNDDPLSRLERPNSGATEIPEAFFEEVGTLSNLRAPFNEVFNSDLMRQDRLLHWLMRSILPSKAELEQAADHGTVLLADSAHHGPILGTDGANLAFEDAEKLADLLAQGHSSDLKQFYQQKFDGWKSYVEDIETALVRMHGSSKSVL